jgi:putative glycosyltransferase
MYHSQNYLVEFYTRTKKTVDELGLTYEFVFVDDGSPDHSLQTVLHLQNHDPAIRIVELSRNFGHQRAMMTGLQHASGDYIYLIDCDLEEEPELLKVFWEKMQREPSLDVVYGIQTKRKGGWFERVSGQVFYKILNLLSSIKYPEDTLTARLMTRSYVDSVKLFFEKELDLWGIFVLTGYRQAAIPVIKKYKGSTTFTLMKKIRHAIEVTTSVSNRPLYFTFVLGMISFIVALFNISVIVYQKFFLNMIVEGWASILASVWLVGGMILLVLGIQGIYLSKMFLEIKNRPLTIVKKIYGK